MSKSGAMSPPSYTMLYSSNNKMLATSNEQPTASFRALLSFLSLVQRTHYCQVLPHLADVTSSGNPCISYLPLYNKPSSN